LRRKLSLWRDRIDGTNPADIGSDSAANGGIIHRSFGGGRLAACGKIFEKYLVRYMFGYAGCFMGRGSCQLGKRWRRKFGRKIFSGK
jgi:hypothetical protein